jgi:hypothetical protein
MTNLELLQLLHGIPHARIQLGEGVDALLVLCDAKLQGFSWKQN